MKPIGILFAACSIALSLIVRADQIAVSGRVTGTWSADTVLVSGDIFVPPDSSLEITPGVEVLFAGNYKFTVENDAVLIALGTELDSIRFATLTPAAPWGGIRLQFASDSTRLEYCHLLNGWADSSAGPESMGGGIYCQECNLTFRHNLVEHGTAETRGGGLYFEDSDPIVEFNTFAENSAFWGGAITCYDSEPVISGNLFTANSSTGPGAGIYCLGSSYAEIVDNTFEGNFAGGPGGAVVLGYLATPSSGLIARNIIQYNESDRGGGIYAGYGSQTISDNDVNHNSAQWAGGIYCENSIVEDNTIINNSATELGGGLVVWGGSILTENIISDNYADWSGGGIACLTGIATFSFNIMAGNSSGNAGIGISPASAIYGANNAQIEVISNTIYGNSAPANGAGVYVSESATISLLNSILWNNSPMEIRADGMAWAQSNYCNVFDTLAPGSGNINLDPLFLDPSAGDFRLQSLSPCINTGDPTSPPNPDSTRADMGALPYDHPQDVNELPDAGQPRECAFHSPAPNPFNPLTVASFELRVPSHVSLRVYDTGGSFVRTLLDGWRPAGKHQAVFDGSDLPSGIYLARITAGDWQQTQKLILLK
jgi:hypothetical protein